jgi:Zn-dependent peptidase ImmA (M78 family)
MTKTALGLARRSCLTMKSKILGSQDTWPYVLGTASRMHDPIAAVRLRANGLIANLSGPPFDLDCPEIRSSIGINQIRYTNSASVHGRVFRQRNGYTIEIGSNLSKERQGFTLAHEIGHTFFQPIEGEPTGGNRDPDVSSRQMNEEETLCDIAAAEMLMPAAARILGLRALGTGEITKACNAFLSRVCDYGPSVRAIFLLAREFGTSLAATSRRLAEMAIWRCHIGFWKLERHGELSFTYGFASKASVSVPKGWRPTSGSIVSKVVDSGQILRGWSNIGLANHTGVTIDRNFVEAAFLPQPGIVITVAVLEQNPSVHCMQVERYDRSNKTSTGQRSLAFPRSGFLRS